MDWVKPTAEQMLAACGYDLVATMAHAAARLAELDRLSLADNAAKIDHTAGDVTTNWSSYRSSLLSEIERIPKVYLEIRAIGTGPFTVRSRVTAKRWG